MTLAGRYYPASSVAERPYNPIESYGAIGNLRSVALVGADGSIDWLCLPNLSDASVFAALLDAERGGRFRVWADDASTRQRYIEATNVLSTAFLPRGSVITVTDFMPLWGDIRGKGRSHALSEIHRLLRCQGKEATVRVEWSPRPDYARAPVRIGKQDDVWMARWDGGSLSLCGLPDGKLEEDASGPVVRGTVHLRRNESAALVTRFASEDASCSVEATRELLDRTVDTWQRWVHTPMDHENPGWSREWAHMVSRSELVLKLLIHDDTGAIAAAPTTSLPEIMGGDYNWDYRYSWLRDSAMAAQALLSVGHPEEALEYLDWIERTSEASCAVEWAPQIMYGLHGEKDLEEIELSHLEGYRGSRPVRIGNGAAVQTQLELYGELMSTGYELLRYGIELDDRIRRFLVRVADKVCEIWERPDSGIWEVRGEERHYTYSKAMLWVALDRGVHMAEQFGLQGDVERWRRTGDAIAEAVLRHGFSEERDAFVEYFGGDSMEAVNLRIPLMELLPFDDPRVQSTINRTVWELMEGGMLYRNRDGLERGEGTFTMCTFWLAQALALSDRVTEARLVLEAAAEVASPLGLFAEMFDPRTGLHLGNYPQAFSHIGFINAVLYVLHAEGHYIPIPDPIGTKGHRERLGPRHVAGVDRRAETLRAEGGIL